MLKYRNKTAPPANIRDNIMNSNLEVGSIIAESGKITYGFIDAGEMQDGSIARIPIVLINGVEKGQVLYIQSVSDGDELNGISVIHRLIEKISPDNLKGGIIAVPITNIFAFHYKQSESPIDQKKLNRCFPGKEDGTSSLNIAHKLFHTAVKQANFCIDLHQGGIYPMIDSLNVRVGGRHKLHKKCMELAHIFDIGYILDEKGPSGQLAQAAPDIGIPTIDPELGGNYGWNELSIQKGLKGVMNVLKYYGFIEGQIEIPSRQTVVKKLQPIYNNRGGFIKYHAQLYDIVEYRQPIAEICDVFGRSIEKIIAPKKGIMWSKNLHPMTFGQSSIGVLGVDITYI